MSETTLAASNAANNYTLKNNEDGSFAIKKATTDVLTISAGGVITGSSSSTLVGNGPMLSVWQNALQAVGPGSGNIILFDQEEYDTANAYNPATGFFTPQVAGFYLVTVRLQVSSGTYSIQLQLGKNGALLRYLDLEQAAGAGQLNGSSIVYLNGTTDYLQIIGVSATSQNSATGQAITWMQATLVRAA